MREWFRIDAFAKPEALLLLLLIPAFLLLYFLWFDKRRLKLAFSYDPSLLKKPSHNLRWLRHIPMALQLAGLACLAIAIARPQTAEVVSERTVRGIDMIILLDVSKSMESKDIFPNRMEAAKSLVKELLLQRESDRIGIVLFGTRPFSYAPLTLDYAYLEEMLRSVRFDSTLKEGSALGPGIGMGINRLREAESKSGIILALTDGAGNRGQLSPISAARLAAGFGYRIYPVGIGTPPAPGAKKSEYEEDILKEIARISGGAFLPFDIRERENQIVQELAKLERSEFVDDLYRNVTEKYPLFMKAAIIFIGLSFIGMLSFLYNPLEL